MGHRLFVSNGNSRLKLLLRGICSLPGSPPLGSRRPRLPYRYAYLSFLIYIMFTKIAHRVMLRMFQVRIHRLELHSFGYVPLGIKTLVFFATIPWLNFIISSVLATALAKETISPFNVITATLAFGSIAVSM